MPQLPLPLPPLPALLVATLFAAGLPVATAGCNKSRAPEAIRKLERQAATRKPSRPRPRSRSRTTAVKPDAGAPRRAVASPAKRCEALYRGLMSRAVPLWQRLGVTLNVKELWAGYGLERPGASRVCEQLTEAQWRCLGKQSRPLLARSVCGLPESLALRPDPALLDRVLPLPKARSREEQDKALAALVGRWERRDKQGRIAVRLQVEAGGRALWQADPGSPSRPAPRPGRLSSPGRFHLQFLESAGAAEWVYLMPGARELLLAQERWARPVALEAGWDRFRLPLSADRFVVGLRDRCEVLSLPHITSVEATCKWIPEAAPSGDDTTLEVRHRLGTWPHRTRFKLMGSFLVIPEALATQRFERR